LVVATAIGFRVLVALRSGGGKPPIGKEIPDTVGRMVLNTWQDVGEVFLGIDAKLGASGDQAHDDGKVLAAFLVADE
jgi:hypothetical protein